MTPTRRCARATTNRGTDDRPIDSRAFASRRENNLREASLDGGVREEVFACVRRARARASARARRDDGCDSRGDAGAVCALFVVLIFFSFSCRRDGTRAGGSFRDSAGRRRRATDERVLTRFRALSRSDGGCERAPVGFPHELRSDSIRLLGHRGSRKVWRFARWVLHSRPVRHHHV